ncbi:phosphohistidine phosphatase SixA [Colwelliaceae bacterium BS250]
MNLFIMRHGDAALQAASDAMRPLTELGILEAKVMAKWLNIENLKIDAILVSPYVRAQQTSQAVIDTLKPELSCNLAVQTLDLLTPEGSASTVHDYLDGLIEPAGYENVLIISHMPIVSYLCAELTIHSQSPIFATAAIAKIDYSTDLMTGQLVKMVSPDNFC